MFAQRPPSKRGLKLAASRAGGECVPNVAGSLALWCCVVSVCMWMCPGKECVWSISMESADERCGLSAQAATFTHSIPHAHTATKVGDCAVMQCTCPQDAHNAVL